MSFEECPFCRKTILSFIGMENGCELLQCKECKTKYKFDDIDGLQLYYAQEND